MAFISPWLLWVLAAAAIPILIHLINRWRHQSIPWAAMDFILKVVREKRGKKKLLHYMILSLRVLAIIVLVGAMARPLLSSFISFGGSGVEQVVLILDRSPSMAAKPGHTQSLQEIATPLIADTMEKLGDARLVLIDSVLQTPIHITSPDTLADLAITKTTDLASDFPGLFLKAAQYLAEQPSAKTEIWIASDMQASDWHRDSPRWKAVKTDLLSLPAPPKIRLLSMRQRPAGNRSIRIEKVAVDRDRSELSLDFTINREGEAQAMEEDLPIIISIDNAPIALKIPLSGEKNRLIRRFPLPADKTSGFGFISLPHDDQPKDDQSFFVFSPPRPASTLIVSPDNESAKVLQTMSAPPGLRGRRSYHVQASQFADPLRFAMVIWQGEMPQGKTADIITQYMEKGGVVLFMPDGNIRQDSEEFLGLSWLPPQSAQENRYFNISSWKRDRGPLRDSAGNHPIPASSVMAIRRCGIAGSLETLAAWDDGSIAVGRKLYGKGLACFLTTQPDYKWSNLAEGHLLIPLLQRLTEQGMRRLVTEVSLVVGDADIPQSPKSVPRRVDHFDTEDPGYAQSSPQTSAGVYALGADVFCVNRPVGEDDPEQLGNEDLGLLLSDIEINDFATGGENELVQELWRLFLFLAAAFLLLEALLCLPSSNRQPTTKA